MDNNFNQQAPQQPVYQQAPQQMPQQPVYQQAPQQMPQQPMYQQAPQQQMYQQPVYQKAPKKPLNVNLMEIIALVASGFGTFLAVLGSILTCSCSASKSYSYSRYKEAMKDWANDGYKGSFDYDIHKMSFVVILAILGVIIAAVGVALAVLALKKKDAAVKAGKMAYIAIAVGAFGIIYGILPMLTICGYNCALDSQYNKLK